MYLTVNGNKYHGATELDCAIQFLNDKFCEGAMSALQENIFTRASEYIANNLATDEEIEDWGADVFGKYCTDELLYDCFIDYINSNPTKAKIYGIAFYD